MLKVNGVQEASFKLLKSRTGNSPVVVFFAILNFCFHKVIAFFFTVNSIQSIQIFTHQISHT